MTAGERLAQLAKTSGTAGALLLLIGSGATAGAALVDYSKLQTATAAQHLLVDHAIVQPPAQQPGIGQGAGPSITSRYSDDRAYDRDRVLERLSKVVIAGKEYDPFDPRLFDILEATAATPEPESDDELERQERKLSRTFVVRAGDRDIKVPMFRPMLPEMPSFKEAFAKDFEKYAEKAALAAAEERRRILLLLLSADF